MTNIYTNKKCYSFIRDVSRDFENGTTVIVGKIKFEYEVTSVNISDFNYTVKATLSYRHTNATYDTIIYKPFLTIAKDKLNGNSADFGPGVETSFTKIMEFTTTVKGNSKTATTFKIAWGSDNEIKDAIYLTPLPFTFGRLYFNDKSPKWTVAYIKINNTWKNAVGWLKVNGTWKRCLFAKMYTQDGWVECHDWSDWF